MKKGLLTVMGFFLVCLANATDYYWVGGTTTASIGAANTLSLSLGGAPVAAFTPTTADVIYFDGADISSTAGVQTGTITFNQAAASYTIGQIIIRNNQAVVYNSSSSGRNLSIGGGIAGIDFSIAAGSSFTQTGQSITVTIVTGNTASISGNYTCGGGSNTHRLIGEDASSITFQSGSNFAPGSSGNPFGTTNLNSVVFASGSNYNQGSTGANPFGATAPNSVVVFQAGSNFNLQANTAPAMNGRTYGNFIANFATLNQSLTGSTGCTILGNLTITNGTLNMNLTGTMRIGGNISVASGRTLTFTPSTATNVEFNGTAAQSITNSGGTLTFAANANVLISNTTAAVTFATAQTISGSTTVNANATLATSASLTLSGTPTINGTFRINQGGYASGGTWTYGTNAKLIYNHTSGTYGPIHAGHSYWPATNGPRRVEVANKVSGGINMGVARTVADSFVTAAGVNGTALTLNGVCQLNDGGFFNTTPVYGGASTLVYNTGTNYGRNNELTTGTGIPANITINAGSGLDYGNGATGTARTLTGNLTVNGGFFMDFGSNDMTQPLTVNGNVSIGTAGTLSLSDASGGDIWVGGNWTLNGSAAFNPKSRTVFFINSTNSTITAPSLASFDFMIVDKSGGGEVILASNATINQTLTLSNGNLSIVANTLTLNAGVSRTAGNFKGGNSSNLTVNGAAGSLFFASGGTNNYLRNLTLGTGGSATLGNALNITDNDGSAEGVLAVNSTSGGLTTGGNLTLKSSASGTARVAAGRTSGGYITGDVTVERFIPQNTRKGWRLLASNTSGQTINAAWQEGAVGDGVNPNPGFGTIITGRTSTFGTLTAANTAGYDALSAGHGLLKYNPATDNLDPVANTNATNIESEQGYFLFVRGNRQAGSIDAGTPTAPTTSTVLRSKGTLFTGNQPAVATGAQGWALVRNPYASRIDMRNISRSASLVDAFQVWDPKVNTVGVYQTFTKNLVSGNYEVTPGGGSYGTSGSVQNFIESGLAFFIQGATGETATVTESCKTSGSSVAFRPSSPQNAGQRVFYSLYAVNAATTDLADGGYVDFDNLYVNTVDGYDVHKSPNFSENFGLIRDGVSLVVERRSAINRNDTLFFNMNSLRNITYRIDLSAVNIDPVINTAFLEDRFTGTSTPIDLTGSTTSYTFQASTTAGSKAADRFRLVFRQSVVVPVNIVSVKAVQVNRDIRVEWKVASQVNVARYEVERSADGRSFTRAEELAASGTEVYSWLDAGVTTGTHFYRIRAVDQNGTFRYSSVVKVQVGSGKAGITVSPNPVTGNFLNLQFSNVEAGKYGIRLINMAGQTVYKREMQHAGGSASESFVLPSGIPSGQYQLDVVTPGNLHEVHPVIIQSGF